MDRLSAVKQLIKMALEEDLSGAGDITTKAIFSPETEAFATIKAKADGVLSGASLIEPIFDELSGCEVKIYKSDGDSLKTGDEIARVSGSIHAILAGERLVLNLLQHLSGVATQTAQLVDIISGTGAKLLDTRKTTPTLRFLEKEAVVHGGGTNHRFGLFDMIMAKDTHVSAAGGPAQAVQAAKRWCEENNSSVAIEVEVQNLKEFREALQERPDRIMLDNMSCSDMSDAVKLRNEKAPEVELEASGNVSSSTIRAIAETGVDFISVGAITHSVPALDIHLVLRS